MTMTFRICFTTDVDNKRMGTRNVLTHSKYTLEKTEGAIKNEHFRNTGNIGYTRHRTKTNKEKNKHKAKKMNNTNPTNNRCSQGVMTKITKEF